MLKGLTEATLDFAIDIISRTHSDVLRTRKYTTALYVELQASANPWILQSKSKRPVQRGYLLNKLSLFRIKSLVKNI